jgi:segregation and condensation protein B
MDLDIKKIIEALLFSSDTPLTIQKLKEIIEVDSVKTIRNGIDDLNEFYDKKKTALKVVEIAGGFQIVSRSEYAPYVQKLYRGRQASRLTQRGLETLAIIAYKQPITKNEMENIRGVNVDGVVKTLLERNLINIEGREKAPGNPLLYGTTKYFLEYFGLKSLEDLPKLKEIDELLKEDTKFLESLDQVALQKLEPELLGIKNIETTPETANELETVPKEKNVDEHGQISLNTEENEKNDKIE